MSRSTTPPACLRRSAGWHEQKESDRWIPVPCRGWFSEAGDSPVGDASQNNGPSTALEGLAKACRALISASPPPSLHAADQRKAAERLHPKPFPGEWALRDFAYQNIG